MATAADKCLTCKEGYLGGHATTGAACVLCNTRSSATDNSECKTCASSTDGGTDCTLCPEGRIKAAGNACTPCDSDKDDGAAATAFVVSGCVTCSSASAGGVNCESCMVGWYTNAPTTNACPPCGANCTACVAGGCSACTVVTGNT